MKLSKKVLYLAFFVLPTQMYAKKAISDTTNRAVSDTTNSKVLKAANPFVASSTEGIPTYYVPQLLDEDIIKDRLACIKNQIELPYNENLQQYIKEFVSGWGREHIKDILRRKDFYFPIFEEILKQNNMPDELKYMAVIESSLKPHAYSYAAAVGLWQFMPGTALSFGLRMDGFVDERMDPFRSTEAACRYMRYLYNFFEGDWHLALAAYNCGEGRVQMAIHAAKSKNFWDVYPFLPYQTRTYVPKFIAMMYVLSYSEEHNFFVTDKMQSIPAAHISLDKTTTLQDFANFIEVPVSTLQSLNPHLKTGVVPVYNQSYNLHYPAEKEPFVEIYSHVSNGNHHLIDIKEIDYHGVHHSSSSNLQQKLKETHIVASGETLADIAKKYSVHEQDLRIWNSLTEKEVKAGTKLFIWTHHTFGAVSENAVEDHIKEATLDLLELE